ncbi:MAG: hypothetical protein GY775_14400 [Candidatus Scalindua sp.]|nr:hypothetical protein [Candidatus Scalindua sp.]
MKIIRKGTTGHVKLFEGDSDWCPLSGQLPSTGNFDLSEQADRCKDIIMKSRQLWGDKNILQKLETAQSIIGTYPRVKKYIESVPIVQKVDDELSGDPNTTTLDTNSEGAVGLVRKHVNPPLGDQIKDYHVLAILAIAEAWDALKSVLYHKKKLNDPTVINQVQIAGNLLAQANKIFLEKNISDLRPRAEYADEVLLKGCVFRKKTGGEFWDIVYDEKSMHPKNSKGFEYIHYLLDNPDEDIHVLQMAGVDENLSKVLSKNTGTLLDNRTTEQLKDLYGNLEEELADKRIPKSDERIAEIKEEMEKLTKLLTAGLDKHGQLRKFPDEADRARKAVSKAIKESLEKIKDKTNGNPALWKHFYNNISTGTYCSYKPENSKNWQL